MNLQALLMALLSGGGSQQQGEFGASGAGGPGNSDIMSALQGFSPVNLNPNYGQTVARFFNQNPLVGSPGFTGASPLQPGAAGNNAVRAQTGHDSFMPTDFNSAMQRWVG